MGPEPHSATDRGSTTAARVLAAATPERWGPSYFGVIPQGGVRRRASDAVQLVLASLLIAICAVVTHGFAARDDGFYEWLSELPSWLDALGTGLFLSCTVGAVTVVVLALLLSRNLRLVLTLVVVGVLTALLAGPMSNLIDLDALLRAAGVDTSSLSAESVVWLAVATAVLLTVAPYLVRPARRFVHAVQLLALLGAVLAAVAPVATILAAVGLGWWISALVSLVIGTPKATPTLHSVVQALSALGISVDQLALADLQTWGETRFVGRAPDGASASIVVIGRDGADARLVSKLWRSLLYRDAGPSIAVTRSAQLEHRAYMLLMAAKAGVPVSEVVIATSGGRADTALLVLLDPDGRPLSELDADLLGDATLDDAWDNLIRLHDARLSHGQLGAVNVLVLPDGSTAFVDFSQGSAGAPEERCLRDRVNLLASTAALVGDERALHAAHARRRRRRDRGRAADDGDRGARARRQAARSPSPRSSSRASARPGRPRRAATFPSSRSCDGCRPGASSWPRRRSSAST